MGYFIQKVWRDPVWSKIISALILYAGTTGILVVKNILSGQSLGDKWWNVFCVNVPLWMIFAFAIFWGIFEYIRQKIRKPAFLKDKSVKNIGGFDWTWHWEYDKEKEKYVMKELHPICPCCGSILTVTLYSKNYLCVNRHEFDIEKVNYIHAKKHILNQIIKVCPQYSNQIWMDLGF